MNVGHVNVKSTIERIQKEISKDKSISPVLISSIELLIVVIQMLFDRQSMNNSTANCLHRLIIKDVQGAKIKKLEKKIRKTFWRTRRTCRNYFNSV
jgi:hypothetical protein